MLLLPSLVGVDALEPRVAAFPQWPAAALELKLENSEKRFFETSRVMRLIILLRLLQE